MVGVVAAGVTAVAVLGGIGVLPSSASQRVDPSAADTEVIRPVAFEPTVEPSVEPSVEPPVEPSVEPSVEPALSDVTSLPAASGQGRRIVFSESRQRVWLVSGRQRVKRTYRVSGSIYENLDPGTYEVYSKSEQAWGIDDSGTMRYFVRFARGERAAIGFHDIPVSDGQEVQTVAQLGTPLSHGCIRQRRADARALWRFAPLGTTVVVTA